MTEKTIERDVVDWEVHTYHDSVLYLRGLNPEGEQVVERSYELDPKETRVKDDESGEWVPLNDTDNGGFPNESRFVAFHEIE